MDILKGRVRPLYFKYLAAASGSALVCSVFGMVDAMMVGRYHGPAGSAALAVFSPLWSIIFCLGLLAGIGGSVLFANCRGGGDEARAQQYFTLSLLYGALLSALAMVVIGLFHDEMFLLFGADEELLVLTGQYFKPIFYAIPCCVFSNILSAFLRNDGNPSLTITSVIIGGAFNAAGDYLCVFVLDMGIAGAGLATAIGQYIPILLMLAHFRGKKNTLRLTMPAQPLRKLGRITAIGFPTAISDLALGIIGILFNRRIMAFLGTDALAIYGVITQITVFAQCLSYGAGQAAQPIISQSYGAGQPSRIRECTRLALYVCAGMGLFWTLVTLLFPNLFVSLFMEPTPSVLAAAPAILRTYGLSYLLLPFNLFATYYFQALMRPRLSMAASLARSVVVSGGMILLLPALFGPDSLWLSMLITELLVACFSLYHMARCAKVLTPRRDP